VGDKAPDFTLPSTTGEKISLSKFRGKKLVLLEFYGADFAPV
jgi:peroxiredoxin Q/BCP